MIPSFEHYTEQKLTTNSHNEYYTKDNLNIKKCPKCGKKKKDNLVCTCGHEFIRIDLPIKFTSYSDLCIKCHKPNNNNYIFYYGVIKINKITDTGGKKEVFVSYQTIEKHTPYTKEIRFIAPIFDCELIMPFDSLRKLSLNVCVKCSSVKKIKHLLLNLIGISISLCSVLFLFIFNWINNLKWDIIAVIVFFSLFLLIPSLYCFISNITSPNRKYALEVLAEKLTDESFTDRIFNNTKGNFIFDILPSWYCSGTDATRKIGLSDDDLFNIGRDNHLHGVGAISFGIKKITEYVENNKLFSADWN